MVGEICDRETADIAIRASLTGHLVLSTLHTNDAAGALTRLTDMGIEPFLIASSVELIIAQRLVRRLCIRCARPVEKRRDEILPFLTALGIPHSVAAETERVHEPAGCDYCRGIGYKGRVGIFEILPVSEAIHDQIVNRASAHEIHEQALKEGMRTLQRCGWEQVKRGVTTLPEIMTYAEKYEE
jgi:type II secretory ATPase GspE/PulE/Tfp pilus assembly ATPase PilB-like protein